MKRVLSFLLMIVFLQASIAPAFAKRGGPDLGGGGGPVATFGTYAGVLVPTVGVDEQDANSIGLFSLGVPDTGLATGAFAIFIEGVAYNGTMIGVADPLNGRLRGVMDAESGPIIDFATGLTFVHKAQGNIDAEIRETVSFGNFGSNPILSTATTRIEGIARVDASDGFNADGSLSIIASVSFIVDGFKQSATTATTTAINIGGNGTTP